MSLQKFIDDHPEMFVALLALGCAIVIALLVLP